MFTTTQRAASGVAAREAVRDTLELIASSQQKYSGAEETRQYKA